MSGDHAAAVSGHIDRMVREMVQRYNDWLEAQLAVLEAGQTLCVHEVPDGDDLYRITVRAQAHALGSDGCDAPVRRTQYGPKP